jgi:hypothetical protein
MWVLHTTKAERRRVTLMAGMNRENTALEAFYVTGQMKNRNRIHIAETHDWLPQGTRLNDLRSFYSVVMSRQWAHVVPIRTFQQPDRLGARA